MALAQKIQVLLFGTFWILEVGGIFSSTVG
jgi:hypothetical protein